MTSPTARPSPGDRVRGPHRDQQPAHGVLVEPPSASSSPVSASRSGRSRAPSCVAAAVARCRRDRPRSTGCGWTTRRSARRTTTDNENAGSRRSSGERQLTALLQLQGGLRLQDAAATVIARESPEFRRWSPSIAARTRNRGRRRGDRRRRRPRRPGDRRRPRLAKVTLISDPSSTVIGQLRHTGRPATSWAGSGRPVMRNIDATEQVRWATRSSPPASSSAGASGRRTRRAPVRAGGRRPARRERVVQTAFLAAGRQPRHVRVRPGDHRLPGRPAAREQQPVPCGTRRKPCRRVSSRASAPTPAHRPAPGRARSRAGHRVPHPDPGAPVSSRLSRPGARRATRQGRRRPG